MTEQHSRLSAVGDTTSRAQLEAEVLAHQRGDCAHRYSPFRSAAEAAVEPRHESWFQPGHADATLEFEKERALVNVVLVVVWIALAVAIGALLAASGQLRGSALEGLAVAGELALDGAPVVLDACVSHVASSRSCCATTSTPSTVASTPRPAIARSTAGALRSVVRGIVCDSTSRA